MYEHEGLADVSTVGTALIKDILASGVAPNARSWDFLSLALAVNAADNVLERAPSPDGWTRQIELEVALYEPEPYHALAKEIEQALRFLTGDFWRLTFVDGGYLPPTLPKPAGTQRSISGVVVNMCSTARCVEHKLKPIGCSPKGF